MTDNLDFAGMFAGALALVKALEHLVLFISKKVKPPEPAVVIAQLDPEATRLLHTIADGQSRLGHQIERVGDRLESVQDSVSEVRFRLVPGGRD